MEKFYQRFTELEQVGEGTFGQVYVSKDTTTGKLVALKKIRMNEGREGFPISCIRECKMLKKLSHPNIVNLLDVIGFRTTEKEENLFLVFEYCEHDLAGLREEFGTKFFSTEQIKCYMQQLLSGLSYLHAHGVLHRDIKSSNLLIDNSGNLKLADFGLSRNMEPNYIVNTTTSTTNSNNNNNNKSNNSTKHYNTYNQFTNLVITLWYRPLELLLGTTTYGPEVDMWSCGCIIAELLIKKALFPGRDEADQIDRICFLCGTPTDATWPRFKSLHLVSKIRIPFYPSRLAAHLQEAQLSPESIDLLMKLLAINPAERISANEALNHPFFTTPPLPLLPSQIQRYSIPCHEWQAKKRQKLEH